VCDVGSMAQVVCPWISATDRARLEAIVGRSQPRPKAGGAGSDHPGLGRPADRRRGRKGCAGVGRPAVCVGSGVSPKPASTACSAMRPASRARLAWTTLLWEVRILASMRQVRLMLCHIRCFSEAHSDWSLKPGQVKSQPKEATHEQRNTSVRAYRCRGPCRARPRQR
jgi:hypothetical protein